jgi:hypothetical protein
MKRNYGVAPTRADRHRIQTSASLALVGQRKHRSVSALARVKLMRFTLTYAVTAHVSLPRPSRAPPGTTDRTKITPAVPQSKRARVPLHSTRAGRPAPYTPIRLYESYTNAFSGIRQRQNRRAVRQTTKRETAKAQRAGRPADTNWKKIEKINAASRSRFGYAALRFSTATRGPDPVLIAKICSSEANKSSSQ